MLFHSSSGSGSLAVVFLRLSSLPLVRIFESFSGKADSLQRKHKTGLLFLSFSRNGSLSSGRLKRLDGKVNISKWRYHETYLERIVLISVASWYDPLGPVFTETYI